MPSLDFPVVSSLDKVLFYFKIRYLDTYSAFMWEKWINTDYFSKCMKDNKFISLLFVNVNFLNLKTLTDPSSLILE